MSNFLDRFKTGGWKRPVEKKKSKHVVRSNEWDKRAFKSVRSVKTVDSTIDELMVMHDVEQAPELIEDAFMLAYKGSPQLREPKELDKSVKRNKQIVDALSELPDLTALQQYSSGDEVMSLFAVERMAPAIKELLEMEPEPPIGPGGGKGDGPEGPEGPEGPGGGGTGDGPGDQKGTPTEGDPDNKAEQDGEKDNSDADDNDKSEDDWKTPPLDPNTVTDILAKALEEAKEDIEDLKDMETSIGAEAGEWLNDASPADRIAMVERLKKMRDLLELVGRMKRFATAERSTRVTPAEHEMFDVELGDKLRRILPHQFALLGNDATKPEFYRKFSEQELLQWKMRGTENAGKGPVVILVDKSGSMWNGRMEWALAVTEAMRRIAKDEGRDVYVQFFDYGLSRPFHFPKGKGDLPTILEMLSVRADGGTAFEQPLDKAMEIISSAPEFSQADIVMITDGGANPHNSWVEDFNTNRQQAGVRVFGLFIGTEYEAQHYASPESALGRVSDHVIPVTELTLDAAKEAFKEL